MAELNVTRVNADIAKFAKAIDVGIGIATERIARSIHSGDKGEFTGIIQRMPVDTGRARAGWAVSIGAPSEYVPPIPAKGTVMEAPEFEPGGAIDGKAPVFITNNVEYIKPLEDGHSKQAPAGFVVISVAAAEAQMAKILHGIQQEAEGKA